MTDDDIIAMAREAGFKHTKISPAYHKLARLIERAALERAAKVCGQVKEMNPFMATDNLHHAGCQWCETEIRALIKGE